LLWVCLWAGQFITTLVDCHHRKLQPVSSLFHFYIVSLFCPWELAHCYNSIPWTTCTSFNYQMLWCAGLPLVPKTIFFFLIRWRVPNPFLPGLTCLDCSPAVVDTPTVMFWITPHTICLLVQKKCPSLNIKSHCCHAPRDKWGSLWCQLVPAWYFVSTMFHLNFKLFGDNILVCMVKMKD
jgi:hypothetical protein